MGWPLGEEQGGHVWHLPPWRGSGGSPDTAAEKLCTLLEYGSEMEGCHHLKGAPLLCRVRVRVPLVCKSSQGWMEAPLLPNHFPRTTKS